MSRIFLSHSSADEFEAVAIKQWLMDNGWDDVFLDIAPLRGLAAGARWQEAVRRAAACAVAALCNSSNPAGDSSPSTSASARSSCTASTSRERRNPVR